MKNNIYLIVSCILVTIISCTSEHCKNGDCIGSCNTFGLTVYFKDASQRNIVGDSVYSIIKYDKDSVKYIVESNFDTTEILTPTFSGDLFYSVGVDYVFDNHLGIYNVIFLLNSTERDTITINTNNSKMSNIGIYNKGNLIGYMDGCSKTISIIK